VSQEAIALWGLAASIVMLALTLIVKSGSLETRVRAIEDNHNGLAKLVAKLETIVERLERTVDGKSRAPRRG
jgi:hypothetical protein